MKLRMGMVGGGEGAFIGAIHRAAAALDGEIELVCGAFSSTPERAQSSGLLLGLEPSRVYDNYQQMMIAEAALPTEQRMHFVAIVTPNHLHLPVAKAAFESGFHVLSDKPATRTLDEAHQLSLAVQRSGLCYGLTHTYTGYPLVKEARIRIAAGAIGKVRKILVEYHQGWLADDQEHQDNKQAQWRLDPEKAGPSSCMGDIGVHAANLAEYVSGLQITEVCADLTSFVAGRTLDDDGSVLLRFQNGANGILTASQVCVGEENRLSLRIYGEQGSIEWCQEEPNSLYVNYGDRPTEIVRAGGGYLNSIPSAHTRTPMGHPEGYLEAFANIYRSFAVRVRSALFDEPLDDIGRDCPGIDDALRGMAFIELVVAASQSDQKWHAFPVLS